MDEAEMETAQDLRRVAVIGAMIDVAQHSPEEGVVVKWEPDHMLVVVTIDNTVVKHFDEDEFVTKALGASLTAIKNLISEG
jgi:hypothetical protein